jgi:hypothetical protein
MPEMVRAAAVDALATAAFSTSPLFLPFLTTLVRLVSIRGGEGGRAGIAVASQLTK